SRPSGVVLGGVLSGVGVFSVGRALRRILGQAVVFGFAARRAQGGAALQQFIGQHQLGVSQPGEGDQGGLVLAVQVDGDVLALGPGDNALEALAALDHAVGLEAGLIALEQAEIDQAGQRPVDAGRGDFQQILARDRIGGVQHLGHGARQAGAFLDRDVVVRLALGHDLQATTQGPAHQAHAHDRQPQALGHGVDQLQQSTVFSGLGPQAATPKTKATVRPGRRLKRRRWTSV
uniref:NAD-specific glutamate dehydrogenase n=1 Tax=Parastrongyloides trichosuri TaxID=131310 RepID=A0A0N4ZL05_PARTI